MSAAEARDLAAKKISHFSGNQAICKRAHAGLVKARAKLLVWHNERRENCEVPKQFWWADGNAALTQNWASGDFETWIDEQYQCQAYGVSFNRADILAMLPPVQKLDGLPSHAPSPKLELSTKETVEWLSKERSESPLEVLRAIQLACRNGNVASHCEKMTVQTTDRYGEVHEEELQDNIPDWFWGDIVDLDCSGLNWKLNKFSGIGEHDYEETKVKLVGLRFNRDDLTLLLPENKTSKNEQSISPKKNGGRQPAEWWDRLWIEICRQLYCGELIPKKQSDLEKAMLDWLATQDENPSVSTIRTRARPLWDAISQEDEN